MKRERVKGQESRQVIELYRKAKDPEARSYVSPSWPTWFSVSSSPRMKRGPTAGSRPLRSPRSRPSTASVGRPLGYAGRWLVDEQARRYGKWKLPRAFPAARVLYNFHRVCHLMAYGCVVVECAWGVIRLHQLGLPAVALFGTHLSETQHALLRQAPRLVLLMDGDPAGRQAASRLRSVLGTDTDVAILQLPDGCDPDDLPDPALQRVGALLCQK